MNMKLEPKMDERMTVKSNRNKKLSLSVPEFIWSAGRYELSDDTGIQIQDFWVGASEASRVYDNHSGKHHA